MRLDELKQANMKMIIMSLKLLLYLILSVAAIAETHEICINYSRIFWAEIAPYLVMIYISLMVVFVVVYSMKKIIPLIPICPSCGAFIDFSIIGVVKLTHACPKCKSIIIDQPNPSATKNTSDLSEDESGKKDSDK
jgi:hypothetical protein